MGRSLATVATASGRLDGFGIMCAEHRGRSMPDLRALQYEQIVALLVGHRRTVPKYGLNKTIFPLWKKERYEKNRPIES
jgi:hypothetical protein